MKSNANAGLINQVIRRMAKMKLLRPTPPEAALPPVHNSVTNFYIIQRPRPTAVADARWETDFPIAEAIAIPMEQAFPMGIPVQDDAPFEADDNGHPVLAEIRATFSQIGNNLTAAVKRDVKRVARRHLNIPPGAPHDVIDLFNAYAYQHPDGTRGLGGGLEHGDASIAYGFLYETLVRQDLF